MPETIVAPATPPGRSGIAVVRLSGTDAFAIAARLTAEPVGSNAPLRLARLRRIYSGEEIIDEALITHFAAPHSFTGENVVEISCHGSPIVVREIIDLCLAAGARPAEAGEFTLRALANGRLDLAEAEAIRDLIDARTAASARQAVRQMRGEFSHALQPIKDELLDAVVVLESALEFVEDDLPETQSAAIAERLTRLAEAVERVAATFRVGHLIRDGLSVVLVGRPNVGKSSLFNALLGADRAIVTEIAGTTRDQIRESFVVGDVPITLTDTAGLRETADTVERIGVERSRRALAEADTVVAVIDASQPLADDDLKIIAHAGDVPLIVAANKIDLLSGRDERAAAAIGQIRERIGADENVAFVCVSALSLDGIGELKRAVVEPFTFAAGHYESAGFLVTDARHFDLLTRAAAEIRESQILLGEHQSEEIVLIGLHNAMRYLGEITGETTTEDMLTRIFATFCIGK